MCELLLKAIDATHADPLINQRDCYKAGDVITIQPDGHKWAAGELDTALFLVIKKPGITVAKMGYLLNAEKKPVDLTAALRIPILRELIMKRVRDNKRRRRFSFDKNNQNILDKQRP